MKNNNKNFFSTENTIKLIRLVHSNVYTKKFEDAEGHPINTANVWKEILKELNIDVFAYNDIKNKFNVIYTKYCTGRIGMLRVRAASGAYSRYCGLDVRSCLVGG